MACIATWAFGLVAVETAARSIEGGSDCVDAVEAAINGTDELCVCVCVCVCLSVYILIQTLNSFEAVLMPT